MHETNGLWNAKALEEAFGIQDKPIAGGPIQLRVRMDLKHRGRRGVVTDNASDTDAVRAIALEEHDSSPPRGDKTIPRVVDSDHLANELLRQEAVDDLRAQAGNKAVHWNPQIESQRRRDEAREGVAKGWYYAEAMMAKSNTNATSNT